jgi:hypothetical protein
MCHSSIKRRVKKNRENRIAFYCILDTGTFNFPVINEKGHAIMI